MLPAAYGGLNQQAIAAIENAMLLHAAFGGSTNLLLHIPAIAHAAGLRVPTVDDWSRINRMTPRRASATPKDADGTGDDATGP